MRIVRQGKLPETQLFRGTCRSCDTEIEFMRIEAKQVSDQRDGDYLSHPCPICKADINVSVR
jgi:hypothetical protein